MITVTRLDGTGYLLNPHLIEAIEKNPDTTITLVSGKKIVITESPRQVLDRIVAYRKKLGAFGNER
ncbi:MAG: flagellar FlbD family protein [Spirochaetes bacterium]|nr:flagellar FlbD family protein [Spirochaetota bacterium]